LLANRHYQAIVKYEEVSSKYGDSIFIQTKIAASYYHLGQFSEAEKRFQQIRKSDPTSLEGIFPRNISRRLSYSLLCIASHLSPTPSLK
jgi:hypothetical protein